MVSAADAIGWMRSGPRVASRSASPGGKPQIVTQPDRAAAGGVEGRHGLVEVHPDPVNLRRRIEESALEDG
jgi:hypothetical protein